MISPDLLGINIHCRLAFKTKVRYMPLQSENYQLVGSQLKLQLSIYWINAKRSCCWWSLSFISYFICYNISREVSEIWSVYIASLFPRNSSITANIDGITRLSCYIPPLQWPQKPWFINYFHWTVSCCFPWMVCTGFTKKLSIISSIDVKRLLRT